MDNFNGPCFIATDGAIINLMDQHIRAHRAYSDLHSTNDGYFLWEKGYIRTNDGSIHLNEYIVELPNTEITEQQYLALYKFLVYLRDDIRAPYVEFGIENKGTHNYFNKPLWLERFEFNKVSVNEIIAIVQQIYKDNIFK